MITKHSNETWTVGMAFAGLWHNQHNSEMELKIGAGGQVSGTFKTATCAHHNKVEEFPITGFVSQDVIAFCVNFTEHGCVTAWVGQMNEGSNECIQTLWHMALDVGSNKNQLWKSTVAGADMFMRGNRESIQSDLPTQASHPLFMNKNEEQHSTN